MQITKVIAFLLVLALLVCCFSTWVTIEQPHLIVSGFNTEGTSFGKPGILHLIISILFLAFLFIPRSWGARIAFFVSTFNIAWAVRNYIVISTCHGGVCPEKHAAIYGLLFFSVLITVSSLFISIPVSKTQSIP